MEPLAPFSKVFEWSDPTVVVVALVLGVGFGFALERGGFGNSRVLAGQWYGYNFAVLRVMFTAIVVSMLGLFGLYYAGVVDLGQVSINETFVWPQLVGGLIFGFGFVIGQYCPGTALVGGATGKFDAMAYLGGFFGGLVAFFFVYPLVERFYLTSGYGRLLLSDVLHLPPGVVVLLVVMMALGAFAVTHLLDRKLKNEVQP